MHEEILKSLGNTESEALIVMSKMLNLPVGGATKLNSYYFNCRDLFKSVAAVQLDIDPINVSIEQRCFVKDKMFILLHPKVTSTLNPIF